MKKKALVTGGTGFVGAHVVRILSDAGHEVRVLHRPTSRLSALEGLRYESALGDITDEKALRAAVEGCDWVFHVAAVADYWRADREKMFAANVDGTRKVLEAARDAGVKRVVFTSSAAAVGLRDDRQPSDERYAFNLSPEQFPYGYSKWLAEEVARDFAAKGLDVVIVNPVVVMGPGDLNMISGSFIVQVKRLQWTVPYSSGGVAVVDVRDVARWHLLAAEKGVSGERYLLTTANYRYREWFALIAEVIGVRRPLFYTPDFLLPPMAALIDLLRKLGIQLPLDSNQARIGSRFVYFDGSKAHRELGLPQVEMRQSLEETYRWYLENGYLREDGFSRLIGAIGRLWS